MFLNFKARRNNELKETFVWEEHLLLHIKIGKLLYIFI